MVCRAFPKSLGISFILSRVNVQVKPSKHELPIPTLGVHATHGDKNLCLKLYCECVKWHTPDSFPPMHGLEVMSFAYFQFRKLSWDPKLGVIKSVLNAATDEKIKIMLCVQAEKKPCSYVQWQRPHGSCSIAFGQSRGTLLPGDREVIYSLHVLLNTEPRLLAFCSL